MKLKCIIIDDEPGSHVVLKEYITQLVYLELCGHCYNAVEGFHFLKKQKIDIVFLDINMPKFDGFAFLEMLEHKPMIIFTTAYSEYALKGFEYNAIDYLQKPIRFERFVKAVEKALVWQNARRLSEPVVSVNLKINGKDRNILLDDIDYAQSMGNYVKIFCGKKTIIANITTKYLESILTPPFFIRIHKSYIVNASRIATVENTQLSINDIVLPIGKTFRKYIGQFVLK